ncbi:hypothetical protein CERSUDRAFT_99476 [Gelatoporia subvermispora B]|uniref:Uncharacterized protein n=1 Tax=Ceriporiopsis subvermispora (strain B) TaxID=914234 RepID=M2Q6E0_CERS8|nr:hypothetical protein CERSUDRAFT_99476 [Gelatoporia subvermispora B]
MASDSLRDQIEKWRATIPYTLLHIVPFQLRINLPINGEALDLPYSPPPFQPNLAGYDPKFDHLRQLKERQKAVYAQLQLVDEGIRALGCRFQLFTMYSRWVPPNVWVWGVSFAEELRTRGYK